MKQRNSFRVKSDYMDSISKTYRRELMKKFLIICASFALLSAVASAQTVEVTVKPLTDSDIQLIRSDVQAGKNDIIAHTMQFTDTESQACWPLYRDYARDQQVIG